MPRSEHLIQPLAKPQAAGPPVVFSVIPSVAAGISPNRGPAPAGPPTPRLPPSHAVSPETPTAELRAEQLSRVRELLRTILPGNAFYRRKLTGLSPNDLRTHADFAQLPFTTKPELAADQNEHPPYG